jgi:hypothetical protein
MDRTILKRMLERLDMTHLAHVLGGLLGEVGAIQTLVRGGKRLRGPGAAPVDDPLLGRALPVHQAGGFCGGG